jgi:hypothetical protein
MSLQHHRTARQYEDELRKHELALARSLQQAVPGGGVPGPGELVGVRRALARAIRDLRTLRRDLIADLHDSEQHGKGRPAPGQRPARSRNDVIAYEAAGNAIDEVLERWERRREQLEGGPGAGGRPGRRDSGRGDSGRGDSGRRRRPDRPSPGDSRASATA